MAQEGSTESYLDDLSYTLGMASTPASRRKSRSARGAEETPKKSAPTTPPRSSSSRRKTGRQSRTEDAADSYKSTPPSAAKTHFSVEDAFATTSSAADTAGLHRRRRPRMRGTGRTPTKRDFRLTARRVSSVTSTPATSSSAPRTEASKIKSPTLETVVEERKQVSEELAIEKIIEKPEPVHDEEAEVPTDAFDSLESAVDDALDADIDHEAAEPATVQEEHKELEANAESETTTEPGDRASAVEKEIQYEPEAAEIEADVPGGESDREETTAEETAEASQSHEAGTQASTEVRQNSRRARIATKSRKDPVLQENLPESLMEAGTFVGEGGIRKSKRQKTRSLEYWRNEKYIYRNEDVVYDVETVVFRSPEVVPVLGAKPKKKKALDTTHEDPPVKKVHQVQATKADLTFIGAGTKKGTSQGVSKEQLQRQPAKPEITARKRLGVSKQGVTAGHKTTNSIKSNVLSVQAKRSPPRPSYDLADSSSDEDDGADVLKSGLSKDGARRRPLGQGVHIAQKKGVEQHKTHKPLHHITEESEESAEDDSLDLLPKKLAPELEKAAHVPSKKKLHTSKAQQKVQPPLNKAGSKHKTSAPVAKRPEKSKFVYSDVDEGADESDEEYEIQPAQPSRASTVRNPEEDEEQELSLTDLEEEMKKRKGTKKAKNVAKRPKK